MLGLSEIRNVNTVEQIDFNADFHVFWLQYLALYFTVHCKLSFFSRHISQCILSVMHVLTVLLFIYLLI